MLIIRNLFNNHQIIKKKTMKRKINTTEAKQISIVDFLENSNIFPQNVSKNDYWYLSPFREEKEPSFKVNKVLNVWYDHGIGVGGTLIDLGIKLFNCSIADLLVRLSSNNFSFQQPIFNQNSINDSKIEIIEIKSITNLNLINYIKERKADLKIALKYCKEIHFRLYDREYYSVGFPNNSGGFELRNKKYKSCISPKDLTLINNNSTSLCVFEGFFDFLSFFQFKIEKPKDSDYLILNSLSFLEKAIKYFKQYEKVYLFLDNDSAGNNARKRIIQMGLSSIEDNGHHYTEYKDLNDYLVSIEIQKEIRLENEMRNNCSLSL